MENSMPRLVLASASERRFDLLTRVGAAFDVIVSNVDEVIDGSLPPEKLALEISAQKCRAVAGRVAPPVIVVAADTIVWIDDETLGKPADSEDAARMLRMLEGRTHTVFTAVTIIRKLPQGDCLRQLVERADVTMARLTEEQIYAYINTGEPFGKAGSYAIQGKGALFVERIDGDFFTVVGLPLFNVYAALKEMGCDIVESWRV